jgi:nucleoid DNA-binding protein
MHLPELIKAIAEETGVPQKTVQEVLKQFAVTVTETVKNGDEVKMQGFVSFKPKGSPARTGRNPKTGAEIQIEAKKSVTITVGKTLKSALNA